MKKRNQHFKYEKIVFILIIALFFCVFSCGHNISNKKNIDQTPTENSQNTIATVENGVVEKTTEFYIKDETKYSKIFLLEFKKYHGMYETVALIEDTIIVNNDREAFIIIPTDLPLNSRSLKTT